MVVYAIDYVEVPSTDTSKSRAFFGKAFGWSFVDFGGTYTEVHDAGLLAGINADEADRSAAPLVLIRTDDIAQAERDVVAAGGTITRKPYNYPGGQRMFFREPGGAELAVYQPAS
jgi:hypothetical protein